MTFYELYGTYSLVFATLCLDVLNMPRNGSKWKNDADTGEVAERFNAAVLKTVEDASPPRVRISASPPIVVKKALLVQGFFVVVSTEQKQTYGLSNSRIRVRPQTKGRLKACRYLKMDVKVTKISGFGAKIASIFLS